MESKKKIKKKLIIALVGIVVLLAIATAINFFPAFSLKTRGMAKLSGDWIDVYFEKEALAAEDVFKYADSNSERIAKSLGFTDKQEVRVFIYDSQKTMQKKKYGLIGPMLGLDWYIGDNIGTDVILTSPAHPGPAHTYEENKEAVLHEIVHAYITVINPKIHLWLTEGCALYLSNGAEFTSEILEYMKIPTYEETKTRNPITFADCGGYTFAHTYIEYLNKTYGWESVLKLIRTEDYEASFGKKQKEIYDEWVKYLESYE